MSTAQDARDLRAALDRGGTCLVGGSAGYEHKLRTVLDRLDELEWIVGMMRGTVAPDKQEEQT